MLANLLPFITVILHFVLFTVPLFNIQEIREGENCFTKRLKGVDVSVILF